LNLTPIRADIGGVRRLILVIVMLAPVLAARPPSAAAAAVAGCPTYPSDNIWNTDISTLPVHARSSQWLASTNAGTTRLHPDFGPSFGAQPLPYGIPYVVTDHTHAKTAITFQYAGESDPGPYPFGSDTPIEGGPSANGDRHALMVDRDTCALYELYNARYSSTGSTAGSGAIWDLRSNALRPSGWTSADAAGLPIFAGLLRPDEVAAGRVSHAIRFTAARTDTSFLWPARHQAGSASDPTLPPMGARFRLRAGFDISHFRADTQVVLRAMQHYGLILADNGSNWYFTGSAEDGWDTDMLSELKTIPASQFEAVDESSLLISPNSGQAHQPALGPPPTTGYRLVASDGGIFSYGIDRFLGSTGGQPLNQPIVGMAATPSGNGYWLVASDGGIFSYGDARFFGSTGGQHVNRPIVGMAPTPSGNGYWLVASDGGIFSYGDARFLGSTGGQPLNRPIVGMAAAPSGGGYWLVASDGGIFSFGGAPFLGSTGGQPLNRPIVAMTPSKTGGGYWLVASDGGIFSYGDARFFGSTGGQALNRPIVGMAPTASGGGYWLVASDGGIFAYGDAPFLGSTGGQALNRPVVGIAR
jgi:hypothetical protein